MSIVNLAKADLHRSGISWEDAQAAGMFAVSDASEIHPNYEAVPALIIPYMDPQTGGVMEDETGPFHRVRYLEAPAAKPGWKKKKALRYTQPVHSDIHAYFPTVEGLDWAEILTDKDKPLIIVEGEKKALAATLAGFPAIGLGGVFNFTHLPNTLLPELQAIDWRRRVVYIVFDSDITDNPQIQAAEARLIAMLAQQHGAVAKPVRLDSLDDGGKVGLDDLLVIHGLKALKKALRAASPLGKLEVAIQSMNQSVCWIERESMIYEFETKEFMPKDSLVKGSKYSSLTYIGPNKRGDGIQHKPLAHAWLTHPHAHRYDDIVFAPHKDEPVVATEAGMALNIWTGMEGIAGNVKPFLELTQYLFKDLPEEHQELPLKLMAFKAQNPGEKIPLALVLVGSQGSGKSLWCQMLREAFDPYSAEIGSGLLGMDYNGFIEKTLLCIMSEAEPLDLQRWGGKLRTLITDTRQPMNEKYRSVRQVDSFTFYIINSNKHGVASFSQDDRRMIVVATPEKREAAFYDDKIPTSLWWRKGGPQHVLHYLMTLDLKGWSPPAAAPMTAEKYMAYIEGLTPAERLAEETKTADENVVVMWIKQSLLWADEAEASNDPVQARLAREITDSVGQMQIRPFYSPEELALMFPSITATLHSNRRSQNTPSGELSRGLRNAGVRYLRCSDDPRGFKWRGSLRQYLIIAESDKWDKAISQKQFEQVMHDSPKFSEMFAK